MSILRKTGFLVAAVIFLAPLANASSPASTTRILDRKIDSCVGRIGNQANYSEAARVVHRVTSSKEVGLAEWEFSIDTLVMAGDENVVIRAYNSTCVTGGAVNIVRFRIHETTGRDYRAAL
jgi:hypothetical protein